MLTNVDTNRLADAGTDVFSDADTDFVADAGTDTFADTGMDVNSDAVAIGCHGDVLTDGVGYNSLFSQNRNDMEDSFADSIAADVGVAAGDVAQMRS